MPGYKRGRGIAAVVGVGAENQFMPGRRRRRWLDGRHGGRQGAEAAGATVPAADPERRRGNGPAHRLSVRGWSGGALGPSSARRDGQQDPEWGPRIPLFLAAVRRRPAARGSSVGRRDLHLDGPPRCGGCRTRRRAGFFLGSGRDGTSRTTSRAIDSIGGPLMPRSSVAMNSGLILRYEMIAAAFRARPAAPRCTDPDVYGREPEPIGSGAISPGVVRAGQPRRETSCAAG